MYPFSPISRWWKPHKRGARLEQARGISDNRDSEATELRVLECADPSRLTVKQVASFTSICESTEFTPVEALALMLGISVSNHGAEHTV
jgi:hypothetical protein